MGYGINRGPLPAALRAHGVSNASLDPILSRFESIDPWSPVWNGDGANFLGIQTPAYITDSISCLRAVLVVGDPADGKLAFIDLKDRGKGTDELIVFEGATGSRNGKAPAFSPMGFVLRRQRADGNWDAHVVFRGSRSGLADRAIYQGVLASLPYVTTTGNPDWLTDMDAEIVTDPLLGAGISSGFSKTLQSCLPSINMALKDLSDRHGEPRSVQVAGHSLGAALACLALDALSKSLTYHNAPLHGYFMALPPVGNEAYCKGYAERFGARTVAPYVAGDQVVELSKNVGFKHDNLMVSALQKISNWSPSILDRMPRPAHATIGENSHEIFLIRSGLLERAKHLPVDHPLDIAQENARPWAQFATFSDLLDGEACSTHPNNLVKADFLKLETVQQNLIAARFSDHFVAFLRIFKKVVSTSDAFKSFHWASTLALAEERIDVAISLRDDIAQADDDGAIDRVATQVACFMAFDIQTQWTWTGRVPVMAGTGMALTPDTLLGESFNARLGLGLVLMLLESRSTITKTAIEDVREIEKCLKIMLPYCNFAKQMVKTNDITTS